MSSNRSSGLIALLVVAMLLIGSSQQWPSQRSTSQPRQQAGGQPTRGCTDHRLA